MLQRLRSLPAQAVGAGVVAAVLGYASSVAVVVAGLTAAGASTAQVGSGLAAVGVAMGVLSIALSVTTRVPVAVVWSTPGLALLAAVGPVAGGFPAVLGALALAGGLIALTGLVRPLSRLLQRLPAPVTSAVLAGILLPFCLAPARALEPFPVQAGVVCLVWVAALRLAPRYAAPAALAALLAVVAVDGGVVLPGGGDALPSLVATAPTLSWQAVTAIALPLYVVTMAAQNLVGAAVLSSYGYRTPVGRVLVGTGLASAATAPLAAPTANLAAITGALTAGPAAHPDPRRRWVAAAVSGVGHLVLAAVAPFTAALVAQVDPRLVATAAGLGLLGAFVGAATAALADEDLRLPAAVTLLVTASGVDVLGLGSAPLGLAAGLVLARLLRPARG
ncbi:benzoate/H(+) symporter BenE family transporter [Vallicoccus soli]|uniref:Benzoate transporter BenE n=1 Tax=Vallicoccus soli TaxID=2339232 RepID=A0A3A3YYR4_9ACTN|nr:benzoate/H(+) symporter BenE family transporter [Vallicoccus soli]RJK94278.1 benzoate transporter BenE [Vallicoccus soli]